MSVVFGCGEVERFVDAYLDGEFATEDRVELERHLAGCSRCARLVRFQSQWRQAFRLAAPTPAMPAELEERVRVALAREPAHGPPLRRRVVAATMRVWPVAAAACLALTIWGYRSYRAAKANPEAPMFGDLITKHRRDLPVEVAGSEEAVRAWFANKVDFAVRPPRFPNAVLRGGRLATVGDREAAYLVYDRRGEKVTVLLFNPQGLPLEAPRRRVVGNKEVFLDTERGSSVVVYRDRDRDLGYAFTSDLDEDQMLQLVSTAVGY